ncbi:putative acyl-coenzyme A synthetase like protein [Verticillium longisporum]|uniref:Putative acyl-coenzyme A synthetase like protein n=1 Tax=Verticillium longisporum TaxID=100787 RepID=A0A8I2ZHV5_VERLO|nr:putative acyl-coenzyme A synthetase like protein [Verticillium longisporum]KAG7130351.1 putative acyl-coenzyme A synthetase like protein [Verticillium longisporum]KAG7148742.1 putative acyl-coenzyme A synthetase like protein [Verticillium longisporum]
MASIVEKRGDTTIYRAPNSVEIPSLDLLSFLFENPQNDRLKSDTILHADAADPSRNVTTAQQTSHLQRLAHTIRTQYGIRDGDAVHVILTGHILCPSVFLSVIAAGATVACSLPTSSPVDIARQIAMTESKLLICSPDLKALAGEDVELYEVKSGTQIHVSSDEHS